MSHSAPVAFDLEIRVTVEGDPTRPVLKYELSSPIPKLGLHRTSYGSKQLQRSPEEFFDDFLRILQARARYNQGAPGVGGNDEQFRIKGRAIFEELFPEELKRKLWDLRDQVRDLIIESSEVWIPWELCFLQNTREGEEDCFFCERFAMTRWIPGKVLASGFEMRPMALLLGDPRKLIHTSKELDWLSDQCGDWEPRKIESSLAGFKQALSSGDFCALHFAGHGGTEVENAKLHTLPLQDGESISPDVLSGQLSRFGKKHQPLVFWNCCNSVKAAQSLSRSMSWPEAFIRIGAGAFIGTLWTVADASAEFFARTFYLELRSGKTLGEAMFSARQALRDKGSDDWLAYVAFGNPVATLKASVIHEQSRSVKNYWQDAQKRPEFKHIHEPMLTLLAVAQEPLSNLQLANIMKVEIDDLQPAVEFWLRWLVQKNGRLSLSEKLKKNIEEQDKEGKLDLKEAHWMLVKTLMAAVYDQKL